MADIVTEKCEHCGLTYEYTYENGSIVKVKLVKREDNNG